MKLTITAAVLLSSLGAGAVFAQTTTSPSSPAVSSGTTATTPSSTMPPAVANSATNATSPASVAGANSFTMAQARKRMEDQGYMQVKELAKDKNSVWRGQCDEGRQGSECCPRLPGKRHRELSAPIPISKDDNIHGNHNRNRLVR